MNEGTSRTVILETVSHNQLRTEVEHNGDRYGPEGRGGYVKIKISGCEFTGMYAVVTPADDAGRDGVCTSKAKGVEMTFNGSSERDALLMGLKMIVKELEENC
jgi:hypothetical protein